MFRKKNKEVWELESIYQTAVMKLQQMEEDPTSFASVTEEEESLLVAIEFNLGRLHATPSENKDEIARYRDNIDLAKTRLKVIESKGYGLAEQRKYVQALTDKRAEWIESQRRKRLSPDAKLAAGVTVACASAPYIIERCGKIAQHLKTKVPLPRIWRN